MKTFSTKAYAKVNLALDVLRRREDGYHDVRMIMQNLDIYDELELTVEEGWTRLDDSMLSESEKSYEIVLTTNREDIPTDNRNLVYKAIEMMFDRFGISASIKVNLIKNIPVEAGMAGGSTDCAAALRAVNELFDLRLSLQELMDIGVKLGADVPYCVMAKTALSEGIGEVLTPIDTLDDCIVLVVKPPVNVSTKMVYTNLKANELEHHPDIDGMITALKNSDLLGVADRMENVLETVTTKLYPEIEVIKSAMRDNGALNSIMSGSGPTVFGLFDSIKLANKAAEYILKKGYSKEIFISRPVSGI